MTRSMAGAALAAVFMSMLATAAGPASAADLPGVTATEIKIGNIMPYSGPASSYGAIGKMETAFFDAVNQQGGVAGHKIEFISLDDGYLPPKAVEQARRLIEVDQVAFLFNPLGTPSNTAMQRYVNQKKVPHLFLATGADKWGDYEHFPWTIGFQPSYRTEAQIYAKYILQQKPAAKIAILYQNDDFGKDYLAGMKDVLRDSYDKMVTVVSYETSDATIDSQITTLKTSGADVLLVAATPKFAAQAIRRVHDVDWHPMFLMTNVSISVGSVITPAGAENAIGMLTTNYLKDATDPRWTDDPGMKEWRAFMARHMPNADTTDGNYTYGYNVSSAMLKVLQQCNGDFSRDNIMKQATSLKDVELALLLPGIKVNTSPTNYHPIRAMQMVRWAGKTWEPIGDVIEGANP